MLPGHREAAGVTRRAGRGRCAFTSPAGTGCAEPGSAGGLPARAGPRWGESWLGRQAEGAALQPQGPGAAAGSVEAGGVKAPRSLQGASGRRLTLTQHPRPGPRGSPLDLPSRPQAGPPTGAGGGVEARPRPRPLVTPALHLRPPCFCACSLCLLPAAIKRPKEKDELCTTPGCVMAGKPRPSHLPRPCPGAGLPRRGWGRGGGRGSREGGGGGTPETGPRPCSGGRKQIPAPVLPAPIPQASPACSGPCPHWTQGLSSAFTLERRPRECTPSATFCPRAFS